MIVGPLLFDLVKDIFLALVVTKLEEEELIHILLDLKI